jgi:hypothetical protein
MRLISTDRRRINDLPFLCNTTNQQLYPAATILLKECC